MHDDDIVQVYQANQPILAQFLCNLLADEGIEARALGGPLNSVDPPVNIQSGEVWVRRRDASAAQQLLTTWEKARAHPPTDEPIVPEWICPVCGESVEADFEVCWNCETPRATP